MKNDIKKKINELLDSDLEGLELTLAIEKEISKLLPFDHSNNDAIVASGLKEDTNLEFSFVGTMSNAVEKLVNTVSKRELAYIFLEELAKQKHSNVMYDVFKDILTR